MSAPAIPRRLTILIACVPLALLAANWTAPPALAAEACPNEQLRAESNLNPNTQLPYSLELPECRAYEMVSPPYKRGNPIVERMGLSADGTHSIWQTLGSFAGSENAALFGAYYEFTRTPLGWQTAALDPPSAQFRPGNFDDVSRDFTTTLWDLRRSTEPSNATSLYLREPASGGSCPPGATQFEAACFVEVGPALPQSALEGEPSKVTDTKETGYIGASADLSHVVFDRKAKLGLWPGDTSVGNSEHSLYEYVGTGNHEPTLVGVSNVGKFAHNSEAHMISDCDTDLGTDGLVDKYNAISTSGETVFFTAHGRKGIGECEGFTGPEVSELYARINEERTVAVSEPLLPGGAGGECSSGEPCAGAALQEGVFQGASEDGERVFFLSEQPLLDGASATGLKLYEERLEGARVTEVLDVSNQGASAGIDPEVQGVGRVSEDGSHVYFVAKGVLTSEPDRSLTPGHQTAVAGEENLYVSDTETASVAFVATLSPQDAADWQAADQRPVQATRNGEFLVFQSVADLTPDDTSTAAQIFEYDAATGELARVSVGQRSPAFPEGYNRDGNTNSDPARLQSPNFAFASSSVSYETARSLSEDGSYVFFASADRLTPAAASGIEDVYEYHWDERALSHGNVDLLANGLEPTGPKSPEELQGERRYAQFWSADASGQDAFVGTPLQLVGQDTDTQVDVYDARIDGGFPAPVLPAECSGEACQGALGSAPAPPAPASTGPPALGNLTPGPAVFPPLEGPKPKPPSRAQKLKNALKYCRKDRNARKRRACEQAARARYGPLKRKSPHRQA